MTWCARCVRSSTTRPGAKTLASLNHPNIAVNWALEPLATVKYEAAATTVRAPYARSLGGVGLA